MSTGARRRVLPTLNLDAATPDPSEASAGYRMFVALLGDCPDGTLGGVVSHGYRWTRGENVATCGAQPPRQPCRRPLGPGCECGFSVATTLGAAVAYAIRTRDGLRAMFEAHNAAGHYHWHVELGARRIVVGRVDVLGDVVPASDEDDPRHYFRTDRARVAHLWTHDQAPAHLARRWRRLYGVDTTRVRSLRDLLDPSDVQPEHLGCAACPTPNPGPEHYPVCGSCLDDAAAGRFLAHLPESLARA